MSNIETLNELLSQNILPDELFFGKREKAFEIDLDKVRYNSFYRSYDFYESKFPPGYQNIPGFDKIIQSMVEKAEAENKTPLQELEELKLKLKDLSEEEIKNIN